MCWPNFNVVLIKKSAKGEVKSHMSDLVLKLLILQISLEKEIRFTWLNYDTAG